MSFNNILVVGNGFDLALGYSTRYIDFINLIKLVKGMEIKQLDDSISSFVDRYNKNYGTIINHNRFKVFKDIVDSNCFIRHFIAGNYDINVWSDVEEEIHRVVNAINSVFNDKDITVGEIHNLSSSKLSYLENSDLYIKRTLYEFNIIRKATINSPYIAGKAELNPEFYDYIYKIKWKQLIKHLLKELDDFKKALIIYLKEFVPILINQNVDELTDKQIRNEIKPDAIINFNYTNYCDEIYGIESLHVHGNLNEEKIVLGFEEDKKLSLKYVRFCKFFQRIQNKLEIIKKEDGIFNKLEDDRSIKELFPYKDNVVHFYGLSFDKTDEDYIKEIYDAESNKEILIYYYDDEDYDSKIINLINIFDRDKITNDIHNRKLMLIPIKRNTNI